MFGFLTVSHWISTTSAERRERERLALLRKLAEQPSAVDAMRAFLSDEDARAEERARQRAIYARRDAIQGGVTVLAVGIGLSVFLFFIAPNNAVWTIGVILILVGAVATVFGYARPIEPSGAED